MTGVLFYGLAALVLTGAVGVMLGRHIVRMAIQLLAALLGVAGLYVLLSAEFIAAAQLVIYVGGTLVLIIFGVMLTARTGTNVHPPSRGEAIAAAAGGGVLLAVLVTAIVGSGPGFRVLGFEKSDSHSATTLDQGSHSRPQTVLLRRPDAVAPLGNALLGDYLLPFELASLLLLAVMLGAAYLARPLPTENA